MPVNSLTRCTLGLRLLLASLLFCVTCSASANDESSAFFRWQMFARQQADSLMYRIAQSPESLALWRHRAAESGDVKAQTDLCRLLVKKGLYRNAENWCFKASRQGSPEADLSLYTIYTMGYVFGEPDKNRALHFLRRSAAGGEPSAWNLLTEHEGEKYSSPADINRRAQSEETGTEISLLYPVLIAILIGIVALYKTVKVARYSKPWCIVLGVQLLIIAALCAWFYEDLEFNPTSGQTDLLPWGTTPIVMAILFAFADALLILIIGQVRKRRGLVIPAGVSSEDVSFDKNGSRFPQAPAHNDKSFDLVKILAVRSKPVRDPIVSLSRRVFRLRPLFTMFLVGFVGIAICFVVIVSSDTRNLASDSDRELLGKESKDLAFLPEVGDFPGAFQEGLLNQEEVKYNLRLLSKEGSLRWHHWTHVGYNEGLQGERQDVYVDFSNQRPSPFDKTVFVWQMITGVSSAKALLRIDCEGRKMALWAGVAYDKPKLEHDRFGEAKIALIDNEMTPAAEAWNAILPRVCRPAEG